MTDISNGTVGDNVATKTGSNAPTSTDDVSQNQEPTKKDTVAYETYQRTLSKLKKLEQEFDQVQKAKEAESKKVLEEQGQWKLVAESERKKSAELEAELAGHKQFLQDAVKINAFLKLIPGTIDSEYHDKIDLNEIILDPDTQKPDAVALESYAKKWMAKHARLVDKPTAAKIPTEAPKAIDIGKAKTIADMAIQLANLKK